MLTPFHQAVLGFLVPLLLLSCGHAERCPTSTCHFMSLPECGLESSCSNYTSISINDDPNVWGSIPAALGSLSSLTALSLTRHALTGTLPPSLGSLTNLRSLTLTADFSGSLPSSLGSLLQLNVLSVFQNSLSSTLPSSLGSLAQLTHCSVSHNQLTGSLPHLLSHMTSLKLFSAFDNQFTGPLPLHATTTATSTTTTNNNNDADSQLLTALAQSLTTINLYDNELSGNIPPSWGSLTNLEVVLVYNNALSGSIPPSFSSLASLQDLDVQSNALTGTLPQAFGVGMSDLFTLALGDNSFSGAVPAGFSSLSSLFSLDLGGNNALSGPLMPGFCQLFSSRLQNCDLAFDEGARYFCPLPSQCRDALNETCGVPHCREPAVHCYGHWAAWSDTCDDLLPHCGRDVSVSRVFDIIVPAKNSGRDCVNASNVDVRVCECPDLMKEWGNAVVGVFGALIGIIGIVVLFFVCKRCARLRWMWRKTRLTTNLTSISSAKRGHKQKYQEVQLQEVKVDISALLLPRGCLDMVAETPVHTAGQSGQLYRCRVLRDLRLAHVGLVEQGTEAALKEARNMMSEARVRAFGKELNLLLDLHHPNLLPFYGVYRDAPEDPARAAPSRYFLVTKFAAGGELRDRIADAAVGLKQRLTWLHDIASGLHYLHHEELAHGAIHPQNVLLDEDGVCMLKGATFTRRLKTASPRSESSAVQYLAPEVLESPAFFMGHVDAQHGGEEDYEEMDSDNPRAKYRPGKKGVETLEGDIYSFGILTAAVLNHQEPMEGLSTAQIYAQVLHEALRPEIPACLTVRAQRLLERMWHVDPAERPRIVDVMDEVHEFVNHE